MKTIQLKYKNQVVETIVDDEDWEWMKHLSLHIRSHRNKFYIEISRQSVHRVVMLKKYGETSSSIDTDHIDRNTLNNQKSNLRLVSHQQNSMNRGPQLNNTSGYKGVYFFKERGNYASYIKVGPKRFFIGTFENVKDAAIAYDIKAKQHYGEFAYLNFPTADPNDIERISKIVNKIKIEKVPTSKFRGVRKGRKNKWLAQMSHNKTRYHIGSFNSELEAAIAYNNELIKINGDLRKLNII